MVAHVLPAVGRRAVAEIRPPEIIAALRPIWGETPETARRTLDRVRAVFTWAIVNEVRERGNPCEGVAKLFGGKREPARHFRAMPYAGLPAFMAQLRGMRPTPARLCLQFVILTACRSAGARHAS
jgi:integrase